MLYEGGHALFIRRGQEAGWRLRRRL